MKKLTKEQVLAIPEKKKTMTLAHIAQQYGVSMQCIYIWTKKLKARGLMENVDERKTLV